MLQQLISIFKKEVNIIYSINAIIFQTLINYLKKDYIKIFIILVKNIDKELIYNIQCNLNSINLILINKTIQNLKNIKVKLLAK